MKTVEFRTQIEKNDISQKKSTLQKELENPQPPEPKETDKIQKDLSRQLKILVSIFSILSLLLFSVITVINNTFNTLFKGNITRILLVGLLWTASMACLLYTFVRYVFKIIKPKHQQEMNKKYIKSFWFLVAVLLAVFSGFALLGIFGF